MWRLLWALGLVTFLVSACASDLTSDLDGKPCNADGKCLTGYFCDDSRHCLRNPVCAEGETVCDNKCVTLATDANNCGGCELSCSAPAHGKPVCGQNDCNFYCNKGYQPCASVCVALDSDAENCGACGHVCRKPAAPWPVAKAASARPHAARRTPAAAANASIPIPIRSIVATATKFARPVRYARTVLAPTRVRADF